jgi:hypothetical protein
MKTVPSGSIAVALAALVTATPASAAPGNTSFRGLSLNMPRQQIMALMKNEFEIRATNDAYKENFARKALVPDQQVFTKYITGTIYYDLTFKVKRIELFPDFFLAQDQTSIDVIKSALISAYAIKDWNCRTVNIGDESCSGRMKDNEVVDLLIGKLKIRVDFALTLSRKVEPKMPPRCASGYAWKCPTIKCDKNGCND